MVKPSVDWYKSAMHTVQAHITGTIWSIDVSVGDIVAAGDTVLVLESMKMEMPVDADVSGVVKEILCEEGQSVDEGDELIRVDRSD